MENEQIPNYTKGDVKISPKEIEAIITQIDIVLAKDVYRKEVKEENQEVFILTVENKEFNISLEQILPKYLQGEIPDGSKLGKFLLKYEKLLVGMKVMLEKDKNNFWKIKN